LLAESLGPEIGTSSVRDLFDNHTSGYRAHYIQPIMMY